MYAMYIYMYNSVIFVLELSQHRVNLCTVSHTVSIVVE